MKFVKTVHKGPYHAGQCYRIDEYNKGYYTYFVVTKEYQDNGAILPVSGHYITENVAFMHFAELCIEFLK